MLFKYTVVDRDGKERKGEIDTHTKDVAISSLQNRGYVVVSIIEADKEGFIGSKITFGSGVKNKDIVVLSKQLATLFDAQVSALRIFKMISEETKNKNLKIALTDITSDISDGSSITNALSKHPKIFSSFYVNMVSAGEEAGKLSQTFKYLSEYLDRVYQLTTKARNALIYPSFVIMVFFVVMYLMLTLVIPKISKILIDSGQEIPFFTKIVISFSDFLSVYGIFFVIALIFAVILGFRNTRKGPGKIALDEFKIKIPYVGTLFKNLYYARIAGNLNMMLVSGVSMIKSLENTATVVNNKAYENILLNVAEDVRGGTSISGAFKKHPKYIPTLLVNMMKVGEESGRLSDILGTMDKFYEREVRNSVDTLVSLIEPVMIVALGVGVGTLLASVLVPIYNITGSI